MTEDNYDDAPYEGEVISREEPNRMPVARAINPFDRAADERTNAGAVAVESQRATAEVQGRMVVAKRFPRDTMDAYARAMRACQRLGLAECAIYSYNKGGKVEGPSIRLAEELARVWGNVEYGINELSRAAPSSGLPGSSEMEAFAWDLETNTRSSQRFTVAHLRDTQAGGKALTTERDIYEVTANMGARRMRARILAILPPELVDDAVAACRETVKRGNKDVPFADRVRTLTTAFGNLGVTTKAISDYLGHALDNMTPDELVTLRGVYQQIKDGAKASEFFGRPPETSQGSRLDRLEKAVTSEKTETKSDAGEPTTKTETTAKDTARPWRICHPKKADDYAPSEEDWLSWWQKTIASMQGGKRALALRELIDVNKQAWADMRAMEGAFADAVAEIEMIAEKALKDIAAA